MENENKLTNLHIQIPKVIHDKVKMRAIVHNCSIRAYVLRALIEKIKQEEGYE